MPNRLYSVGSMSFYNCSSLKSIDLRNNLLSINYGAFILCSSLKDIKLGVTKAPEVLDSALSGVTGVTLHLPSLSTTGYDVTPWTDTTIFQVILNDIKLK